MRYDTLLTPREVCIAYLRARYQQRKLVYPYSRISEHVYVSANLRYSIRNLRAPLPSNDMESDVKHFAETGELLYSTKDFTP